MKIDGKTKMCGLIGDPVMHSMSPLMHNAAFEKLGLNFKYLCFRVEKKKLKEAIQSMRALNIAGFNVTVPHKQEVMKHLDEIDAVAKKIGAVNTIVNKKGKLTGFNTDWKGLVKAIEEHTEIKDKKIVIVGAGGTGRAIAFGILKRGGNLTILNRTIEKARELAKELGCKFGGLDLLDTIKADFLINSTLVGMHPHIDESIATKEQLKNFKIVVDVVYNPFETELLKLAKKTGCLTISGLKMLVFQGAESFELWTGMKPDTKLMFHVAKKKLTGE
jgi:shikimate dehydrogenase